MVAYVRDTTGRFSQRPHYKPEELDYECETIITAFLKDLYGEARFPVQTDDLTKLIERDTSDFDPYADLSDLGPDVEGVTEFYPKRKPAVKISASLANDERRENRLRTTMTHEYGHVRFHAYLWEIEPPTFDLLKRNPNANKQICKRETILNARDYDWMEWQAGYICGALLMPATVLRRHIRQYVETHSIYGAVAHDSEHARALLKLVMDGFQVSEDAARVRLFKLGILTTAAPARSLFS
jgi:hypothetical protein